MISAIEGREPDLFRYLVCKDEGTTGRYEVTVFKDRFDLAGSNKGVLVHSKLRSSKFVHDDIEGFLDTVEEIVN